MGNGDFKIEVSDERQREPYQQMLDRMEREFRGRPVDEIRPALRAAWKRIGGDLTDPELTTCARRIKDGDHVEVGLKMRH
jgi:hypothetical protein